MSTPKTNSTYNAQLKQRRKLNNSKVIRFFDLHLPFLLRLSGKNKAVLLINALCILLFTACSTRKNTLGTRAYHEFTTRYNVYHNAEEAYNNALQNQSESYEENYSELLPLYPFTRITDKTQAGGTFDAVIDKTNKAIQEHSIAAKPRRDPSQPQTQEYRDWLRQQEFNPFIKNAWLLMGKAHLQNQDYEQALAIFSQIIQLFRTDTELISETQIWMMRAYTELEWFYDAEDMATILRSRTLSKELNSLFTETYTYYLLRKKEYAAALPLLRETIAQQKNAQQKRRLQFLLGQIYAQLGENENAFRAFEAVKSIRAPHETALNATILQSTVAMGNQQRTIVQSLEKMAKSTKNKEFTDKIYFAIGNSYLHRADTTSAIKNYRMAESAASSNGFDKALAQIALGDIFFNRKEYVQAAPRYSGALSALPETNEQYARVSFRSDVLQELVPHVAAVQQQDSLQHLAKLPHNEQLKIIQARIDELRKAERGKERETYLAEQALQAPQLGQQTPTVAESAVALATRTGESAFYFYNPPLVLQGKNEFKKVWGNRQLQDNWRISGAQGLSASNLQTVQTDNERQADDQPTATEEKEKSTNPYEPEFYLQQLPSTPDELAASNKIIENGLFVMGEIIAHRLQDFEYAISIFNRHLTDFPKSGRTPDVYHQLYLIYFRLGNNTMAQVYKQRLLQEYPDNELSLAVQAPDFEKTLRNYAQMQESIYQQAFQAYQNGNTALVHKLFEEFTTKFPDSDFMPQMLLLNALSYAQAGDAENTQLFLAELLQKHPDSDATPLAQNIMDGLSEGKTLAANASLASNMDWRKQAETQEYIIESDTVTFIADKNLPHIYLLTFPRNTVNKNNLLFAVANFNFSNFQLRTFPISFIQLGRLEALQVKSFRSYEETRRYADLIQSDEDFLKDLSAEVLPIIISEDNLTIVQQGKPISEYADFHLSHIQPDTLQALQPQAVSEIEPIKTEETIIEKPKMVVPLEAEEITQSEEQQTVEIEPVKQDERVTPEQQKAELKRKEAEALRQQQSAESQKSREEILRERERERRDKIRERERQLKERQRQRDAELKQREREREQKLREQERLRRQKLQERERELRNRNR